MDRSAQRHPASLSGYYAFRDRNLSFEAIGAINNGPGAVRSPGAERDGTPPDQVIGLTMSPSMFDVFGVSPWLGRAFPQAEDQVDQVAQTLDQQVQYQYLRLYVLLVGLFGGVALGAGRHRVVAMVLRQASILVFFGLVLGLTGALTLTGVIKTFLYGVASTDPRTYLGVSGLLTVVALAACWIPARRATCVDPTVALRSA